MLYASTVFFSFFLFASRRCVTRKRIHRRRFLHCGVYGVEDDPWSGKASHVRPTLLKPGRYQRYVHYTEGEAMLRSERRGEGRRARRQRRGSFLAMIITPDSKPPLKNPSVLSLLSSSCEEDVFFTSGKPRLRGEKKKKKKKEKRKKIACACACESTYGPWAQST